MGQVRGFSIMFGLWLARGEDGIKGRGEQSER